MLVEILIALAAVSLLIFCMPVKQKWIVAVGVIGIGALVSIYEGVKALSDITYSFSTGSDLVFGLQSGSIDALSALFLIIISWAAVAVIIYSKGYLKDSICKKTPIQISIHYFSLIVMYISMLMVVMLQDGFSFLFAWELMTISSFVLILFDAERSEVRRAALNYLILMHIGFVFLLIGFTSLYIADLPVTFDSLSIYFSTRDAIPLFIVFLIGFGMKAGIFPLHIWLPEAHPAAPSHISAFMSGVMIKMGVYGVFRVLICINNQLLTIGIILLSIGIITALWGTIFATLQNDMKKILAYSSIENIGIIFIGLGVGVIGKHYGDTLIMLCGLGGALLHTVNHSLFKTLLFLSTGAVYRSTHTTHLDALGGIGKRMPITSILFLIASLSICAMPPFNGFISELLIYLGLFDGITSNNGVLWITSIFGIIFLALIGGLVMMAFSKLYSIVFLGSPRTEASSKAREASASMLIGMALPLTGIISIGIMPFLFTEQIFAVVGKAFAVNNYQTLYAMINNNFIVLAYALITLITISIILWIIRWQVLKNRVVESSPTWGCGFTSPNAHMQYSGESFSDGLGTISGKIANNTSKHLHIADDEIFPMPHNFETKRKDRIETLFSAWWVELLHRINERFSSISTGKVNHYILYAMLFLALILLLSILNIL